MVVATLAGVSCIAAAYFGPQVMRYSRSAALARQVRRDRLLILTFDDGPSPGLTPRLLDLLAAHGAKATFFMSGWRAEQHPEIASRTFRDGHECACHSYEHLNSWKVWPWEAAQDIS